MHLLKSFKTFIIISEWSRNNAPFILFA